MCRKSMTFEQFSLERSKDMELVRLILEANGSEWNLGLSFAPCVPALRYGLDILERLETRQVSKVDAVKCHMSLTSLCS